MSGIWAILGSIYGLARKRRGIRRKRKV